MPVRALSCPSADRRVHAAGRALIRSRRVQHVHVARCDVRNKEAIMNNRNGDRPIAVSANVRLRVLLLKDERETRERIGVRPTALLRAAAGLPLAKTDAARIERVLADG